VPLAPWGIGVLDGGERDDHASAHVEANVELPIGPSAVTRKRPDGGK
jgi:hypothetical protein